MASLGFTPPSLRSSSTNSMEDPRRQWTPRPRFVLHEGPQVRTQDEQKPIMSFWYQGIDILAGILSTAKEIKDILVSAVEEIHRFRQDVANMNARENIPILFSTDAFSTSSTPEGFNPPTPPAFDPPTPEPMELPCSIDQ
ncbi:unnamed protein product [Clonostachys rosea f. rosea IK726]|uniref:Uncharacterized protein n=4 Tax=Bionectria ochroleuca TaxID=29856 RepID=A0A0B7KPL9_BIOOC|nr:unnamed protein product [Clonostachys rosea f. rosea IK726]CAG9954293.1 unnamed protein product [Clonostachys rosea f. rosea IK726]CAG9954296.1 unnamed protein product [Clonostachys rosea f. rosea IK726]